MLEQIATRKEEVRQEIKETFEELKAALDKRCNDLLMETEEIASAKRNSVEKQLDGFRKLVKQVSHGHRIASSVSERTDPGEVLSVKKLITNQLEECIEEYKKLPLEIEEIEVIIARLGTPALSKEISKFGSVLVDIDAYSIESGLAIPLATVKKERKFKVALPAGIDKAASYLKASFIKIDGSKEEGRVVIVNDNNTAIVSCTPQSIGGYELSVTIRGHHIKGSPYQLSVKAPRDYTTLTNQRSFNVENYTGGVAVHTNGEVFASSDGFVQVFSEDGTAVRMIGSKGYGNGLFECPFGLLLVGDRLYVSDANLNRVQYFSATTGQYIGQFGSSGNGNGQFSSPHGMSTDGKGNILVADYGNSRVQVFKEDGTFVQVIQCDGAATDVAIDNEGKIYVTFYNNPNNVQVFSPDGKHLLHTYNNPHVGSSRLQGVAIDDDGHILVSTFEDISKSCVYALSPDGKQVELISGLRNPHGIALDKDGYIYVAEYSKRRIMKY
ncbi:PREDICTED: tripartite motif-containing protein 2-like [Amphimedon queenslandica]|uniref:B-box C-terminal domain-containing protein n=1 Tax=Amphimedon queenslandica TaxID=400682 RepID=A0AAN0IRY0_AMPQE|nr:PREDICTED: tripartite motif-containing protein 2-like [Amphimedon queenslandica]|eukprot:XP_011408250.1 PREDICTED: tripartite motif-containing protein 2-like [Amphimedon queenslandica]